jgi:hypothetical protein
MKTSDLAFNYLAIGEKLARSYNLVFRPTKPQQSGSRDFSLLLAVVCNVDMLKS